MPMNWDGNANCKLLLSILKTQEVKVDFEAVAKELTTETVTCTPRAVQEQLKKLKKQAKEEGDLVSANAGENGAGGPKPNSAKKRAAGKADGESSDKKPRNKPASKPKAKTVKQEVSPEDEA